MSSTSNFRVYWQPGCTSCLKAKEFLARHGIEFASLNVRSDDAAMRELQALGARSVPVIARGAEFVYGQDLDDVARFIGVELSRDRLPATVLVDRLVRLLRASIRYTRQLPPDGLETLLPGRSDRAVIDLAWHPGMIVAGFLDAARGGCLEFEYFERRPLGAQRMVEPVAQLLETTAADLEAWWQNAAAGVADQQVDTYYGRRPLDSVLERTAWHVAQHCRQLEALVRDAGAQPDGPLGAAELDGLPLPEGVWDREQA